MELRAQATPGLGMQEWEAKFMALDWRLQAKPWRVIRRISQILPSCCLIVSLIQFWILRVSRRLLLLWRRQSRPPSLTLATSTSSLVTFGLAIQKNATTGVAGANVAGYGPECPSLVNDSSQCRSPDAPLSIPLRGVRRCIPVSWRRGAVSHDGRWSSFGSVERAVLRETRWLDSRAARARGIPVQRRRCLAQRGNQDLVGRVALRRRRAVRHRWMCS